MNKKIVLALIFSSLFIACTKTETAKPKEEMIVEQVVEEKPEVKMEEAVAEMETEEEKQEEDMTGVLAIVEGEKITEADIEVEMNNMPEQYKYYFETEEGKAQLLERIIQQKLILKEAYEAGMENDEEFVKNVEAYKESLLASQYITKEIFDKVTLSDEELKAEYEKKKEIYKQPEQVNASHILIKTEGLEGKELEAAKIKAIEILNRALEGDDFAQLAANYSEGPSGPNGGNLGWFTKGQMVEPFENAAFAGEKGAVYPKIVETRFGYHIIKVDDKKEESYIPFEEVSEQLKEETLNQMRYDDYNKVIDELQKKYEVEVLTTSEDTQESEVKEEEKSSAM